MRGGDGTVASPSGARTAGAQVPVQGRPEVFMNCRESRTGLIELARGGNPGDACRQALLEHLEGCAECAAFLDVQQALTAAMGDLSAAPIPPSDEFAAPVMAEFDRVHPQRRPA